VLPNILLRWPTAHGIVREQMTIIGVWLVTSTFSALFFHGRTHWSTHMSDNERRLLEAERALYRLELQVEQHHVHVAELGAHPCEAEKAHAVLNGLTIELERQRKYCELLAKAVPARADEMNGWRVA
jgi:hypothetical protein